MNKVLCRICRCPVLPGIFIGLVSCLSAKQTAQPFQSALAEVNAQCPEHYDAIVTPLPEEGQFEAKSSSELLRMLESWNPSLRATAATALGTRHDSVPVLLKAAQSETASVRAGACKALAAIIKDKLKNWKDAHPDIDDEQEAQKKILMEHTNLEGTFIRLTRDPLLEVRVSALQGLSTMAPQSSDAALAVLELCKDEDAYLAQNAMIILDKRFSIQALQEEKVVAALRQAMRSPLPRGRGHVLQVVKRMEPDAQREFIPELLAHLDWQPDRDTMFGAGGQSDAIQMLTKFGVKELVPRLPGLMGKTMRGPGLFMPCLESAKAFGADAKVLLPTFRGMLAEFEKEGAPKMRDREERLKKLRETIAYLEKQ